MNYKMMGQFVAKIVAVEAVFMVPAVLISLFCGESAAVKGFLETFAAIPVYRTARDYSFPALLQAHRDLIPRDMDVYLLSAGVDHGQSRLMREMERAGNTVTLVKIPVTEL